MSQTKEQLIDKLQNMELVNDKNKERFDSLQKADLEAIAAMADKIDELTEALGNSEADLEAANEKIKSLDIKTPAKPKEATPGHSFKHEGLEYQFSKKAPKFIRFMDKKWTQEELAKDKDAVFQLLAANSSLIVKK